MQFSVTIPRCSLPSSTEAVASQDEPSEGCDSESHTGIRNTCVIPEAAAAAGAYDNSAELTDTAADFPNNIRRSTGDDHRECRLYSAAANHAGWIFYH